jgi:DNA replication protein DnaC
MTGSGGVAWRLRHPCQDFAASVAATRGLIAGPWTPLAFLCSAGVPGMGAVAGIPWAPPSMATLALTPVTTLGAGLISLLQGDSFMTDPLRNALKKLRLSGLLESLEVRLQEAAGHSLSHAEFLELLVQDELAVRSNRQFQRRLKAACFRDLKTLDRFDWSFNPSIKKKQVYDLATGRFIREARDVLWLGPPGLGKSHLVQAIGYQALKADFVVLYRSIFDVVRDFLQEAALGQEDKILAKYLKPDLLIIDDMGMKQLPKRSGEYLFEIIMRRYETRSTMMTSNRPLEDWGKLIGDVPAATAILDRFLHHAEIIQLTGKSYRLRSHSRQNQEEENGRQQEKTAPGSEMSKQATPEGGAQGSKQATLEGAPLGSKQATPEEAPIGPRSTKKTN